MGKSIIIGGCIPDDRVQNGRIGIDQELWLMGHQPYDNDPPKWDRWFQLYGLGHIASEHGFNDLVKLAVRSLEKPVYLYPVQIAGWEAFWDEAVASHINLIPFLENMGLDMEYCPPRHNFLPFPIEEMCEHFSIRYFTGPYALLTAFVVWLVDKGRLNADSIGFSGTNLWPDPKHPQYLDEHWAIPCLEYWLGIAHTRGIRCYPDTQITGIMHDVWGWVV